MMQNFFFFMFCSALDCIHLLADVEFASFDPIYFTFFGFSLFCEYSSFRKKMFDVFFVGSFFGFGGFFAFFSVFLL